MDASLNKVQKHVDSLKAKNSRLADENQKLKDQLKAAKSINTRIRRIAKPEKGAPTTADTTTA